MKMIQDLEKGLAVQKRNVRSTCSMLIYQLMRAGDIKVSDLSDEKRDMSSGFRDNDH